MSSEAVLLTRREIAALLSLDECIAAVEQAFRLHAEGRSLPPAVLSVPAAGGAFHVKAAGLRLERTYFAAKTNGNFSDNPQRHGLPAIQGVVILCDGERGTPLAIMDSIEITILRTGAATAVAARLLARPDSRVATLCGCGRQGRIQLHALTRVLPLQQAYVFDRDPAQARRLAAELAGELGFAIEPVTDLPHALGRSDVCVTCTPARRFFVRRRDVAPGTFIAAVGADSSDKQELEPALLASSRVVVDSLEQCAAIGELHHALESGLLTRAQVHAELGEVVARRKAGRTTADEIIVFDSTGTALQDVAAAAAVYEKAVRSGAGLRLDLAG